MKPPAELTVQLEPFVESLDAELGDDLQGVYVFGSSVTGEKNYKSDIDTCVITGSRRFESDDDESAAQLARVHADLGQSQGPLSRLESVYFASDQVSLQDLDGNFLFVAPGDDGPQARVCPLKDCSPIIPNAIREQGAALYGPPAEEVFPIATREAIQRFVGYMINESGIYRPAEADETPEGVALRAVELLRLYYTYQEEGPVTKQGVMDWLQDTYPDVAAMSLPEVERVRRSEHVDRQRLNLGLVAIMDLKPAIMP